MNAFRVARAARPAFNALRTVQRRGYADVAADKIQLSLALPHQAIYKSQDVVQVNIPAESGEMGILANHVPAIEQLKPGLVEIIEEAGASKQFFLSGGFATVQPGSKLSINAVEGYALEDFSAEAVKNQIAEAQKIASGNGSEQDIAEAKIELEVLESLQAVLNDCHSPLLFVRDLDHYFDSDKPHASSKGNCNELNYLAQTPQEPFPVIAQGKTQSLEALRYRWLTHASRLCDRRRRRSSDAPVVALLDTWAIEHHKRQGEILQAETAGACRVVDSHSLPRPSLRLGGGIRGLTDRPGRPILKRRSHSFRRHSVTNVDIAGDAEGDAGGGARRNVIGDHTCATATSDNARDETRYTEAKALETGDSLESYGPGHGAASPDLTMRQVRLRNGLCTATVGVPRPCDERIGGQTARCRSSSGGRSRRSTTASTSSDRQRLVVGQVCHRCHNKKGGPAGREANTCCQPCAAIFPDTTSSAPSDDYTQSATFIESLAHKCSSRDICDHATSQPVEHDTSQPVEHDTKVPLPRRCSERGQEYAYARDDARFCSRPIRRAIFSSYDGCTPSDDTNDFPAETCEISQSFQDKATYALPHNCESPVGLDGSLEEAESSQPQALERRRTRREKPPGQVASRIRELELKNAIPMPKHFRPAGHTRHNHDRGTGNHRSQLHRDEKPDVDLIFPLRVRRFSRRGADGAPIRPETPLHRSIPDEEPHIHSPQPARSMPMLKDPPEHDSLPSPKLANLDTSHGNREEERNINTPRPAQSMPMLRDPPEDESNSPPKSVTLGTSRGNRDDLAVASGYGRRTSRNFNVRRNSRP
ncbi:hypothetical protein Q7P35_011307 [Cladosporium inversicolor]